MNRPAVWILSWILLAAGGCAWGGAPVVALQTPDGGEITLTDGDTRRVGPWALNALVFTLPVTDAVDLRLEVRVDGRVWDNKVIQKLQPMAPLVFALDAAAFALTATALFRVTDGLPHTITVTYDDETIDPVTTAYTFVVPASGTSGGVSQGGS